MFGKFQTIEEARNHRYGRWGGCPNGVRFREDRCAEEFIPAGRSGLPRQCDNRPGYGPGKLYCKKHDPAEIQRRYDERQKKYEMECEAAQRARIAFGLQAATTQQLKDELRRRKDLKRGGNP